MGGRIKIALAVIAILMLSSILAIIVFRGNVENALEIRDRSIEESGRVSSYYYRVSMKTSSSGFLEGANVDLESSINGSGMIDVVNRFMYTPVQIRITGSSNGSPVNTYTRIEMYVVNNTLYSKSGQMWIKQRLEEDSWSRTQLDQQSSIIKDAGVNLVGREEIRGEETYVLELSPNLKNLMDYAVEVNSKAQPTGRTNESVEEYAITEWISAKTFLPLKTVNTLTLLSENVTTTIEVTTEYYNYNKLVEDKLPYEAENAVEI